MKIETSWDDGNILDLKVAKLLKKYKLPGTFYIVVDWIDSKGYLTWEDVKRLDKEGFEIGSHTMSHPQDMKLLFDDELKHELENSKGMIESVLGHEIKSFCYPRGRYDQRVIDAVIEAGYLEARTTKVKNNDEPMDKLQIDTTIHVFDRNEYEGKDWLTMAKEWSCNHPTCYFHLWGHSWEIEKYNQWERLEEFFKYVKEK